MKIAFFEVQDWERPLLDKVLTRHEVRLFKEPLTTSMVEQIRDFEVISVFIYSSIDSDMIDRLEKLRLITTRSTGFDHIDLQAAKKRGIVVSYVPTYGETTVAEHAFALILALSRNIIGSNEKTKRGEYACEGIQGFDLNGKTIGVLGTGKIGTRAIEIAKGFRMQVLAYDRYPNMNLADGLDFKYVNWPELLERADIVTLHLPLNQETYHFLNKDSIARMKNGAIVINTARGGLIDSQALSEALVNGHLGGAGLDVLEEESLIREETQLLLDNVPKEQLATMLRAHIISHQKNVIITPHCAFNSRESLERLVNATVENIEAFIAGKPQNIVK